MFPRDFDISKQEQERLNELIKFVPKGYQSYLDVGTRYGYLPLCLVDHFKKLTAVDLAKPDISHPKINVEIGDIRKLSFLDESFDVVTCTEVLEHIPSQDLATACSELARITKRYLLIGVPYKQDLRVGRSRCNSCGKINPPWGHVNSFDESLVNLFSGFKIVEKRYYGKDKDVTNWVSAWLVDLSGYMYGTKGSEGHCIFCGAAINDPHKTLLRSVCVRTSIIINDLYKSFLQDKCIWIHVLFEK